MGLHPAIDPAVPDPLVQLAGFGPGVQLATPAGDVPVDWLAPGDRLITKGGEALPVLWIGRRRIGRERLARTRALWPVEIAPGAFGPGCPTHPTRLAPATRVLLTGWEVELFAGTGEALAAIAGLDDGGRIAVPAAAGGTLYSYVVLPAHALVRANGMWTETLLLDRAARSAFAGEIPPGLLDRPQVIAGHAAAARLCLTDWELASIRGRVGAGVAPGPVRHVA